jgi:isopenicillin-N epimerase
MVPVDLESLGAAYWTGNAHKWLCAPKGAAVLHVRADMRPSIRPLVTSHGANDDRRDRSRFRLAFDWTGTADPTPWLSVPAAIRYVGGLHPDGWPGLMAANEAMARQARDRLCTALGIEPPAPDAMLGSMAAVPLPGIVPTRAAAQALQAALFDEDRIEVPVYPFPVPAALPAGGVPASVLLRVSAQQYNRPEEYDALAASLAKRVRAASSPRSLLGRLRRG